jgi:hypothetical protein
MPVIFSLHVSFDVQQNASIGKDALEEADCLKPSLDGRLPRVLWGWPTIRDDWHIRVHDEAAHSAATRCRRARSASAVSPNASPIK